METLYNKGSKIMRHRRKRQPQQKGTQQRPQNPPKQKEEKKQEERVIEQKQFKIEPITKNHLDYIHTIEDNTITFCIGPAGSSKSYTSIGVGCEYLLAGTYDKIIICRPAVEAVGNQSKGLGYLKGDLEEKLAPYILPTVEHLKKFLGKDRYGKLYHEGKIQFKALEYCRGLSFDNAYIIGEEFQSASTEQIKMFVTRIGKDSKMVLSGDLEQSDVKRTNTIYSTDFEYVISKIEYADLYDFGIMKLNDSDIVRNKLIGPFLQALK